jgi:hypothetical protein
MPSCSQTMFAFWANALTVRRRIDKPRRMNMKGSSRTAFFLELFILRLQFLSYIRDRNRHAKKLTLVCLPACFRESQTHLSCLQAAWSVV